MNTNPFSWIFFLISCFFILLSVALAFKAGYMAGKEAKDK